jgi:hypothetical protein
MTSHLTHLRAQQQIAERQRQADRRLAAMTDGEPAKPRRSSPHRHRIVLSTVQSAPRLDRRSEWFAGFRQTIRGRTAQAPATNKQ